MIVCIHIYIYIYICIYIYIIYIYKYTHLCTYAYIHTYVYIHVYMYTYAYMSSMLWFIWSLALTAHAKAGIFAPTGNKQLCQGLLFCEKKRVSKSVQVLFNGIEAVMVWTLLVLKCWALLACVWIHCDLMRRLGAVAAATFGALSAFT